MEKDLLKLASEKEIALMKLEISDYLNEARLNVERLKLDNEKLRDSVDRRVDCVKSEVSSLAIDKSFSIMVQVRNWILVFGLVVTLFSFMFGFLGIKNISDNLTDYFKNEVDRWLRFESEGGPVRETLDEIRNRALLDSYIISLVRSKVDGFGSSRVNLSEQDKSIIVSILLDENTSFTGFLDALKIISSDRWIYRFLGSNDDVGKKIVGMLESNLYSHDKKMQVLNFMRRDKVLLPYAKSILESKDGGGYDRSIAFENVSIYDPDYAMYYAVENIKTSGDYDLRVSMAVYIAKIDSKEKSLMDFINNLKADKPERWGVYLFKIAEALMASEDAIDMASKEFSYLVEHGGRLVINDSSSDPRYIAFSFEDKKVTYYSEIDQPIEFLSNNDFFHKVFNYKPNSVAWIKKVVSSIEVVERGFNYTSVLIYLDGKTKFKTKDDVFVSGDDITGGGWLRVQGFLDYEYPVFVWRDSLGKINNSIIDSVELLGESRVVISFDEKLINSLDSDRYNLRFLN